MGMFHALDLVKSRKDKSVNSETHLCVQIAQGGREEEREYTLGLTVPSQPIEFAVMDSNPAPIPIIIRIYSIEV